MFTNEDLTIVVNNEEWFAYIQEINHEVSRQFDIASKELRAKILDEVLKKFCEKNGIKNRTEGEVQKLKEAKQEKAQKEFEKENSKEEVTE